VLVLLNRLGRTVRGRIGHSCWKKHFRVAAIANLQSLGRSLGCLCGMETENERAVASFTIRLPADSSAHTSRLGQGSRVGESKLPGTAPATDRVSLRGCDNGTDPAPRNARPEGLCLWTTNSKPRISLAAENFRAITPPLSLMRATWRLWEKKKHETLRKRVKQTRGQRTKDDQRDVATQSDCSHGVRLCVCSGNQRPLVETGGKK